ncbi:MAG: hypothetical protein ACE5JU_09935 [Candidatus Binatia bacterium]
MGGVDDCSITVDLPMVEGQLVKINGQTGVVRKIRGYSLTVLAPKIGDAKPPFLIDVDGWNFRVRSRLGDCLVADLHKIEPEQRKYIKKVGRFVSLKREMACD